MARKNENTEMLTVPDEPGSQNEDGEMLTVPDEPGSQNENTEMLTVPDEHGSQNENTEMLTVPDEPGSQNENTEMLTVPDEPDDQENSNVRGFHTERDLVWNTICKYISHLSDEKILEVRREFCGCVNSIIDAYEEKLREVKTLKNKLKVWKGISHGQGKKIEKLERDVLELTKQLASKVCEDCGEKRITEQFSSLSVQGNETEQSPEGRSEIDGGQAERNMEINRKLKKRPREVEENDDLFSDGQDSDYEPADVYKCKHASCGFDALLYMFYKIKINFCPFKFFQMIGTVTSDKGPNCTHILNNVKDKEGHFLKRIYQHENIDEGKQKEALKTVEDIFMDSDQKVGILSYWTVSHNHCVNIYKSKDSKMKIYDANRGRKYIENLNQVRYLEVTVLNCDENDGVPHISKRWSKCHARHCERELKKLPKLRKSKASSAKGVLKENNPGTEQL